MKKMMTLANSIIIDPLLKDWGRSAVHFMNVSAEKEYPKLQLTGSHGSWSGVPGLAETHKCEPPPAPITGLCVATTTQDGQSSL